MDPATVSFPSKDLTPILHPPHVVQLYLSVRALYHSALVEAQPVFRGWK